MARHNEGAWFRASKGTWYATVDGRSVSLGVKGENNRRQAQEAFYRLMAGVLKPDEPKSDPKPRGQEVRTAEPDSPTVRELVDHFMADARGRLKPATVRIYGYDLGTLCKAIGDDRADKLTPQHFVRWLNGLDVNSTTKAMTLRSASACFGWAAKNDFIPSNPVRKVPKPRGRSRSQDAVISDADHARLTEAATPDFRRVLRVLHATGCRPGEACGITAENLHAEVGAVVLNEHKCDRTGKPRLIFVPPELCRELKGLADRYGSGPLLRSRKGKPWTQKGVTQAMRRVRLKAGVRAIAYGYRHTFATDALSKGVPDAQVAALLGHSSTTMLHRHYSHLGARADVLRQAAAQVRG